jgi:hypothetical protein
MPSAATAAARASRGVRPVLARPVRQVRSSLRFRACAPICLARLDLARRRGEFSRPGQRDPPRRVAGAVPGVARVAVSGRRRAAIARRAPPATFIGNANAADEKKLPAALTGSELTVPRSDQLPPDQVYEIDTKVRGSYKQSRRSGAQALAYSRVLRTWIHVRQWGPNCTDVRGYFGCVRQIATWRDRDSTAIFRPAMSTISRIPEIILRQRAIARSLPAFGLALASAAVGLVMLAVHV